MSARGGFANTHSKYCDLVYRAGDCDCGYPPAPVAPPGVERMPCADVTVTILSAVEKLCPVKNERDEGTVAIAYRTDRQAFELHALADYLRSFRERHLSHEDFTFEVALHLGADVTSTWQTAGMTITCGSAVE